MVARPIVLIITSWLPTASSSLMAGAPMRGGTRFFLDTAQHSELSELLPLGIFHGVVRSEPPPSHLQHCCPATQNCAALVAIICSRIALTRSVSTHAQTTNPTILERCGVPCTVPEIHSLAKDVYELGAREFMCQAWGGSADELFANGVALSLLPGFPAPVVKVPVTAVGVEAAARLQEAGVRVCLTACYASTQALVAGSLGVEYLAPYLGRMSDNGKNGLGECATMQQIVDGLGAKTRILVASIRDVESMAELATQGCDTFTFSPDIARALFSERLTEEAARAFEEAAVRNGAGAATAGAT